MPIRKKRYIFPGGYSTKHAILDILLDFGSNSILFETPYQHIRRLSRRERGIPEPQRWRYNRAVQYLKETERLEVLKKGDRLFIKLTKKGKLQALLKRLESDFERVDKWDGKWRIIIWDIPEQSEAYRHKIRRLVKDLGFYQLQKSVFITPHPLPVSAVEYLQECELLKFIRFLRVDKLDDDRFFRRHFQLT